MSLDKKQRDNLFASLGLPEETQAERTVQNKRQQPQPSADTRAEEDRERVRQAAAATERRRGTLRSLVLIVYEYDCDSCGSVNFAPGCDEPLAEYINQRSTRHLTTATLAARNEAERNNLPHKTEIRQRHIRECVGCWDGEITEEPAPRKTGAGRADWELIEGGQDNDDE